VRLDERSAYLDVWLSLLAFWVSPMTTFLYLIWREGRRLRRERDLDRLEEERMRAEGYPPPDPPTA